MIEYNYMTKFDKIYLDAGVAELADAPGLGPGERKLVEVRVLSPAPEWNLAAFGSRKVPCASCMVKRN